MIFALIFSDPERFCRTVLPRGCEKNIASEATCQFVNLCRTQLSNHFQHILFPTMQRYDQPLNQFKFHYNFLCYQQIQSGFYEHHSCLLPPNSLHFMGLGWQIVEAESKLGPGDQYSLRLLQTTSRVRWTHLRGRARNTFPSELVSTCIFLNVNYIQNTFTYSSSYLKALNSQERRQYSILRCGNWDLKS